MHARQFDAVITPMRAPASGPALQTENENRMNVSMSTKKRVVSSVLVAVMGISLLYGTGCSVGRPSSQQGTETVIEFPAAEAFTIDFDLPEGWTVRAREADAKQDAGKPLALASVASVYDLYDAQVTNEQQRAIASSLEFQE